MCLCPPQILSLYTLHVLLTYMYREHTLTFRLGSVLGIVGEPYVCVYEKESIVCDLMAETNKKKLSLRIRTTCH